MKDVFINYTFFLDGIYLYLILPVVHFGRNLHALKYNIMSWNYEYPWDEIHLWVYILKMEVPLWRRQRLVYFSVIFFYNFFTILWFVGFGYHTVSTVYALEKTMHNVSVRFGSGFVEMYTIDTIFSNRSQL